MRKLQLETKYFKTKTQTNFKRQKKQKTLCKLYRGERTKYCESLDMKRSKLFLSDKNTTFPQISTEKNTRITLIV